MPTIFLLFLTSLISVAAPYSEFSRAPYVQLANHEMTTVVWRTAGPSTPVVKYGQAADQLTEEVPADQILIRLHSDESGPASLFHDTPKGTHQFEATIKGLSPDTIYHYGIFQDGKQITGADGTHHFKTHPIPGSEAPVYFWVVGDSGTGGSAQAKVHDAMIAHNEKTGRKLDLYLHVGDMAYGSGTNKEFSDRFFKMYEPTLRNTVCWASMGNHEGRTSKGASGIGPYYDAYICPTKGEVGGLPSGKEAFYSFDYGKVHFICLDSHDLDRKPSGEMAQWLKADLEKTKAEFLIAYFHHPPYTKGSHDSDREGQLIEMREHIMPILESGGVDVVFTGHSHIYERSMLIDGAYQTPTTAEGVVLDDGDGDPAGDGAYRKSKGLTPNNGTVQVVTGHGGTGVRRVGTIPLMKRIIVENGSCLFTIKGDTILGEMLNLNGEIRDTFAITKKGVVEHTPIVDPWQPEPKGRAAGKSSPKVPKNTTALIPKNAKWSYLAGKQPRGSATDWTQTAFDHSSWPTAAAGFGYGDKDDVTYLSKMRGKYTTVYLRREFDLPKGAKLDSIGLSVSYDDAFIAYLNGKEVLRVGVDKGQGATADGFTLHEADNKFDYFPLKNVAKLLEPGGINVLAIEGHNANLKSSDFTIHPLLLIAK